MLGGELRVPLTSRLEWTRISGRIELRKRKEGSKEKNMLKTRKSDSGSKETSIPHTSPNKTSHDQEPESFLPHQFTQKWDSEKASFFRLLRKPYCQ